MGSVAAAVGISGCAWPFLIQHTLPVGARDREALLPTPWFDVHGEQDDRVFEFLTRMTAVYLQHRGASAEDNLLATVPTAGHVDVVRSPLPLQVSLRFAVSTIYPG